MQKHIPVLIDKIIEVFNPSDNSVYIDGTFGAGGYTSRFLDANATCKIIAFDRDEMVVSIAEKFEKKYGDRFHFINDVFSNLDLHLKKIGVEKVDGFIFDIGVSSMQIDMQEKGFSFRFRKAPLDMRMGKGSKITAAKLLNTYEAKEIKRIIKDFGEEKQAFQIAKAIVKYREREEEENPFQRVGQLLDIIEKTVGQKKFKSAVQRVFQALRIYINNELEELEKALDKCVGFIKQDGFLGVVSFHSLEDRIVKNFFKKHTLGMQSTSRYSPDMFETKESSVQRDDKIFFSSCSKKAIVADGEELDKNSRSHSARFRWAKV